VLLQRGKLPQTKPNPSSASYVCALESISAVSATQALALLNFMRASPDSRNEHYKKS